MSDGNDKTRKRDIIRHGLHKAASKFGSSQAEPSVFSGAITATTTVAQAHNPHYPVAPLWTNAGYPDESESRGPPDGRMSGKKSAVQYNRLDTSSSQGGDDKKKKKTKVEDNKTGTKNDSKKKT